MDYNSVSPLLVLFAIVGLAAIKSLIVDARNDERNNRD